MLCYCHTVVLVYKCMYLKVMPRFRILCADHMYLQSMNAYFSGRGGSCPFGPLYPLLAFKFKVMRERTPKVCTPHGGLVLETGRCLLWDRILRSITVGSYFCCIASTSLTPAINHIYYHFRCNAISTCK